MYPDSDDEKPKKQKKKFPKPIMTPYGFVYEDEEDGKRPKTPPEKTKEEIMEELPIKVKKIYNALQQMQKKPFPSEPHYYLLSIQWFKEWKIYAAYDEILSMQKPNEETFAVGKLSPANKNLLQEEEFERRKRRWVQEFNHYNMVLKPDLKQNQDFIYITEEIWEELKDPQYHEIKRFVVTVDGRKEIQLYYIQLKILLASYEFMLDTTRSANYDFYPRTAQYTLYGNFKNFLKESFEYLMGEWISPYSERVIPDQPRLWILPEGLELKQFYNELHYTGQGQMINRFTVFIEGDVKNEDMSIKYMLKLQKKHFVMVEYLQIDRKTERLFWNFENPPDEIFCSNCNKPEGKLEIRCSCKNVFYCSLQCKKENKFDHRYKCVNAAEEEKDYDPEPSELSKNGLIGIKNLMTTSFFSAGIFCLSHLYEITQYFLKKQYLKTLHKFNPNGSRAQIPVAYAKLLRRLWYGTENVIIPLSFKRSIYRYDKREIFEGYHQEVTDVICFVLNKIHKDINKVHQDYVQKYGEVDKDEETLAQRLWVKFRQHNQSIIPDLVYGQIRKEYQCDECKDHDIEFQNTMRIDLPVDHANVTFLQVLYLNNHNFYQKIKVSYQTDIQPPFLIQDLLNEVRRQRNTVKQHLLVIAATFTLADLVDPQESVINTRKKYPHRTIYVRELLPRENPEKDIPIMLGNTVYLKFYEDQSYRKSVVDKKLYYVKKQMTLKQLHHKLLGFMRTIRQIKDYENEVINMKKQDQPIRLLNVPFDKNQDCEYCKTPKCTGCYLPYDSEITVEEYSRRANRLDFQIYWRKDSLYIEKMFKKYADPVYNINGQTQLINCFKYFEKATAKNIHSNGVMYYCLKCKKRTNAVRWVRIFRGPKIMMITLKKYNRRKFTPRKKQTYVNFPLENLDLTDYISHPELDPELNPKKSVVYDCFAFVGHYGRMGSFAPHYCCCLHPTKKKWYRYEDEKIEEIADISEKINSEVYLLFYRRRD